MAHSPWPTHSPFKTHLVDDIYSQMARLTVFVQALSITKLSLSGLVVGPGCALHGPWVGHGWAVCGPCLGCGQRAMTNLEDIFCPSSVQNLSNPKNVLFLSTFRVTRLQMRKEVIPMFVQRLSTNFFCCVWAMQRTNVRH